MRGAGEVVTIRVATGTTHTENHAVSTNRFSHTCNISNISHTLLHLINKMYTWEVLKISVLASLSY